MNEDLFNAELEDIASLPEEPQGREGYVYVFYGEGTNYIKVGRSVNVANRLMTAQTNSPFRIVLLYAVYSQDAVTLERLLHASLAKHRMQGEWFAVPNKASEFLPMLATIYQAGLTTALPEAGKKYLPAPLGPRASSADALLLYLAEHKEAAYVQIREAFGVPAMNSSALRTRLSRLCKKGVIGRTKRGMYFLMDTEADNS